MLGIHHFRTYPQKFSRQFVDNKIPQLDQPGVTIEQVMHTLGPPVQYLWNDGKNDHRATKLPQPAPDTYSLVYPFAISVFVAHGRVQELRSEGYNSGFSWHGLFLSSSLDSVLATVGKPSQTIVGQRMDWSKEVDGVLYKDIGGEKGNCYYCRPDQNVRFFFLNYNVMAMYLMIPAN
jgi:hypothetical protein